MADEYAHIRAEMRRRDVGPICALCREVPLTPMDLPEIEPHLDSDPPKSFRIAFCQKRRIQVCAQMGSDCQEFERRPEPRLPKSLRHWAERAGFYPSKRFGLHRRWRRGGWFVGMSRRGAHTAGCRDRRRFIRVLPHLDRMDICDGYFDRWSNSTGASVRMPRDEGEFREAIRELLSVSRARVARTHPEPSDG